MHPSCIRTPGGQPTAARLVNLTGRARSCPPRPLTFRSHVATHLSLLTQAAPLCGWERPPGNGYPEMTRPSTDTTPDRGLDLAVANVTLVSVAIVSISLRCYTRVFIVKSFKPEDWLMLLATVSGTHSLSQILLIFISSSGFVCLPLYFQSGEHLLRHRPS